MHRTLVAALAALSCLCPSAFSQTYAFELKEATWKRALAEIREDLRTRRPGDIYEDHWLELIDDAHLDFQGEAVWTELAFYAPSLKTTLEETLTELYADDMVEKAKAYAREHREALRAAYRETCRPTPSDPNPIPVPPSVDVAIKCIETGLDWCSLNLYPTLAVLVSFTAVTKAYVQEELFDENLPRDLREIPSRSYVLTRPAHPLIRDKPKVLRVDGKLLGNKILTAAYQSREKWIERAKSRGEFVRKQLHHFFNNGQRGGWSHGKLLALEGSWIGAYSPSQGIPSTIFNHQREYPRFDPDSHEECALFTMKEIQRQKWGRRAPNGVFLGYNNADWYANYCVYMEAKLRDEVCRIVGVNYPLPLPEEDVVDESLRPSPASH